MKRIKDAIQLYRIYRQCNPAWDAAKLAWVLSGG